MDFPCSLMATNIDWLLLLKPLAGEAAVWISELCGHHHQGDEPALHTVYVPNLAHHWHFLDHFPSCFGFLSCTGWPSSLHISAINIYSANIQPVWSQY